MVIVDSDIIDIIELSGLECVRLCQCVQIIF